MILAHAVAAVLLAAAAPDARALEHLGRFPEAAAAYEHAYEESHDAALLYRLGLCRRRAGQYVAARQSLRAYLHAAPDGELVLEAERQLAQLDVLIDEQARQAARTPAAPTQRAPGPAAVDRKPPAASLGQAAKSSTAPARPVASPGAANGSSAEPTSPAAGLGQATKVRAEAASPAAGLGQATESSAGETPPGAGLGQATKSFTAPTSPLPAAGLGQAAKSSTLERPGEAVVVAAPVAVATPAERASAPTATLGQATKEHSGTAAPAASLAAPVPAVRPAARAAPWVAAGAGACAVAGAALWWDGARVSSELDDRFAAGTLSGSDSPRYARAKREAVAGRVLAGAALALGVTSLVLWW